MTQNIRTIRIATQGPAGPAGSGSGHAQIFSVASQASMLALAAQPGDIAVRTDISTTFVLALSDPTQIGHWTEILAPGGGGEGGAVTSVAGRTGAVALSASDISGLAVSATTDTTNAGNVSSGTLNNARLSGVALTANNLSDLGNAVTARGNLGLAALATLGVGSGLSSGGGNLSANVTSVAGRTGAVALSAGDVSGLAASATTDTTNASNIASGTLNNARLSGVALTANNLSDLANAGTARTNLGLAASATTDTTNAGNISSGTLPDARHSANIARRDQDNTFADHALSRFCGVVSSQTADYTLQASDNGTIVFFNKATAGTVTLPNSLPAGFNCVVVQEGAGQVTFTTASGATRQSPGGTSKTSAQYGSVALLVKTNSGGSAADWRLDGALTT